MRSFVRQILVLAMLAVIPGCELGQKAKTGMPAPELKAEPTISIYNSDSGKKSELGLEEYIAGVVAGEMLPNWPRQAYEAQAIVARTYTLELLERTGGVRDKYGTDVSTDEKEVQAYNPSAVTPVIQDAVSRTKGQVIVYRGKYARTWFHAASGGKTARAKEGLNIKEKEPAYTDRVKVNEPEAPPEAKSWSLSIPLSEVSAAVAKQLPDLGEIKTLKITQRGLSGRVTKFNMITDQGTRSISGPDLRILVGPERMRSTLLTAFTVEDGQVMMEGRGFGHGVGMSQWGAYSMAKRGLSGSQITKKFFRNIRIQKVYQ